MWKEFVEHFSCNAFSRGRKLTGFLHIKIASVWNLWNVSSDKSPLLYKKHIHTQHVIGVNDVTHAQLQWFICYHSQAEDWLKLPLCYFILLKKKALTCIRFKSFITVQNSRTIQWHDIYTKFSNGYLVQNFWGTLTETQGFHKTFLVLK